MKKTIALILALVLCLSLCACGKNAGAKAIIGEWKSPDDSDSIVFNEDGTGAWGHDAFAWSYDKDTDSYTMLAYGMTTILKIEEEGKVRSLSSLGVLSPWTYYHEDDYNKAVKANK